MLKVKTVVFDLTGGAMQWLDKYGNEGHMEVCELITMDDDSPLPITDIAKYSTWDYLLVFEDGLRKQVNELLMKLGVPDDKILYPLDLDGSIVKHKEIAAYMFKDEVYRYARYMMFRDDGDKYAVASSPELYFMNLTTDDSILPTTYISGYIWAQDEMELFYKLSNEYFEFTKDQDLFCDIGANIGTTSIYYKKKIDTDVRILAFEPSNENFKLLQINAILNDISISDNYFEPTGLSSKKAEGVLSFDESNPGGSSLVLSNSDKQERVLLTTFDSYLDERHIDVKRIKYLWIDVEGHEARFLMGAYNTLAAINVPVFMEFVPRFYDEQEFSLLVSELQKHYSSFICIQHPDKGRQKIDVLWKEINNTAISWDLFLLKH